MSKSEDNSPRLISELITMIVLSSVAIVLRFWSRALLPRNKFGADDWTALGAWPFVITALGLLIGWASHGLGQKSIPLTPLVLKVITAKELVWNTGITLSRISALLFYRRLFQGTFKILFWLGIAFNVAWWIMLFFFIIFDCSPVQRQWDRSIPGTCLPDLPGQILSSITSLAIDLYILILPLPIIYRLQMKVPRKIAVAFILVLGYSVPVLSLGRFVITIKNSQAFNDDANWGFGLQEFWSICEISISFIGCTIPGVFSLVKRALQHGPASLFTDREYTRLAQVHVHAADLSMSASNSATKSSTPSHSESALTTPSIRHVKNSLSEYEMLRKKAPSTFSAV